MKVCKDCFATLMKSGECIECNPIIEELENGIPKKKTAEFPKTPKKGFEWYGPSKNEKWFKVESPYKKYKDGV